MKPNSPLSLAFSRSTALGALLLGAWAAATGCGLSLGEVGSSNLERNSCSGSEGCPSGTECSAGICTFDRTPELRTFLLSASPPAGSGALSGLSFFRVIASIEDDSFTFYRLPEPSTLRTSVTGSAISSENCVPALSPSDAPEVEDGRLPFRMTLAPRTRLFGLPSPPVIQETPAEGSRELEVAVPAGNYDVYVEPLPSNEDCVRPPVLFVDQELPAGSQDNPIELPEPQVLKVRVVYPRKRNDLSNWELALIERNSGRLLSNRAKLGEPVETSAGLEYSALLAFSQLESEVGELAAEIVRLSPPPDSGKAAPTLYIERSIIELFQEGEGLIDQLPALPEPISLGARVTIRGQAQGVRASVSFVATKLAAVAPGIVAGFSTTVETNTDGELENDVSLLPGSYRVLVSPKDESLARTETEMVVGDSSVQKGRTFEVSQRQDITGRLRDFGGRVISGVSLVAQPSPTAVSSNVLTIARGQQAFLPGSVSDVSDGEGRFSVPADQGSFSLFARPQSSSGYAWYVQLHTQVEQVDVLLNDIRLPPPAPWEGEITSASGDPIPHVILRAYGFVDAEGDLLEGAPDATVESFAPPENAEAVIPIAETRADEDGRYRLLLPSSFK